MNSNSILKQLVVPILVIAFAVLLTAGFMYGLKTHTNSSIKPSAINIDSIKNLEYRHSYCKIPLILIDGIFSGYKDFRCNQESMTDFSFRIYNENIALGDINSDGLIDAAAVVSTNYGGSGDFRELVVILNENGHLRHVTSSDLGDRVIIDMISIQDSRITLNMFVHMLQDPACCPTQQKLVEYELAGDNQLRKQ